LLKKRGKKTHINVTAVFEKTPNGYIEYAGDHSGRNKKIFQKKFS